MGAKINKHVEVLERLRERWLSCCHDVVRRQYQTDPAAGITFRDPFDLELVRWYAAGRQRIEISNGPLPLLVAAPVDAANVDGDYPVNYFGVAQPVGRDRRRRRAYLLDPPAKAGSMGARAAKLRPGYAADTEGSLLTAFPPRLVHTLDASFAGHMAEQLVAHGVHNFALVHDCILLPADVREKLRPALEAAAREWFLGLAPIFALFDAVAPDMRRAWEQRKADCEAGRDTWPRFRMKAETTLDFDDAADEDRAVDWLAELALDDARTERP